MRRRVRLYNFSASCYDEIGTGSKSFAELAVAILKNKRIGMKRRKFMQVTVSILMKQYKSPSRAGETNKCRRR